MLSKSVIKILGIVVIIIISLATFVEAYYIVNPQKKSGPIVQQEKKQNEISNENKNKLTEPYTVQWEKEPIELDYTELNWPKEWTKELEDGSLCILTVLDKNGSSNPIIGPYRVGKFTSGKYVNGEIISLFSAEATMGGQWAYLDRFIKLNNNYIYLTNNSTSIDSCMNEFLKEVWNYNTDNNIFINELVPPQILTGPEPNQRIYYKEDSDRNDFIFCKDPWNDKYTCNNKVAFRDINHGITVYFGTGTKGEDFSVRMPDGFEKTYTFKYEEIEKLNNKITLNTEKNIQVDYTAYHIDCSTPDLNLTDFKQEDMIEIGKNTVGDSIYIDKGNKETKSLYDKITEYANEYRPFNKTYEEFEKELPLFFWTDPFGRIIEFMRADYYRNYLAPDGCS